MKTEHGCVEASLRGVKDLLHKPGRGREDEEEQDESRYVDLELVNAGGTKPEQDGERNLVNSSGSGAEPKPELAIKAGTEQEEDHGVGKSAEDIQEGSDPKSKDCLGSGDKPDVAKREERKPAAGDEGSHCGNSYWCGRSECDDDDDEEEEDDDVSLVLSDDCVPCVTEDESHYITTHEIQLSELSDHEGDYDLGVASSSTSWDIEDDNQVYSFVDYASFAGDDAAAAAAAGERGADRLPPAVSSLRESEKARQQGGGDSGAGQIHLSITTTSRAINDPSNIQERENVVYHARRSGDMSRYVLRGVEGKAETLCDGAKCFIAAPGRLHFGRRLRGKEVTGSSSGASSAVSELDDADKEVRNLTARAFKSLAYPYLDAINFSTSSESSASEHGINRWSTFVDLKYGNMNVSRGLDPSVSHPNSTASLAQNVGGYKGIKAPSSKIFTLNANPHKKLELMGKFSQAHSGVITLTETLNFRCNVKSGVSNFAQNAAGSRSADEVTSSVPGGQRRGASQPPSKTMEDTHKKAIFASSLIKNVISKKMQFEQERKMERGEISEPHHAPSPCVAHQEGDAHRGRAGSRELHRQSSKISESSSDFAIMCVDELGDIVDSGAETHAEPGSDAKKGAVESKSTLLRSQNSAFRCWKEGELEFQKDHKSDQSAEEKSPAAHDREAERDQDSSKHTKMSHLFVPSIQLVSSDGEAGQLRDTSCSPRGHRGGGGGQVRNDNTLYVSDSRTAATSKSPEIKINLRSVRNNKTEPFGVSKLRAPNIGCNPASLLRTDEFKSQALAAALKAESADRVPHFMVRDIRENKGKLQTPIHTVRDVRKLVKSSYHFVSLDNNDHRANSDSHPEQKRQMSYRNPNSVSPIVIKCQSVNTNSNGKQAGNLIELSKPFDTDRSSPEGAKGAPLQMAAGRAANNSSEGDTGLRADSRLLSKRQEKPSDLTDKKPESKMANQVALEKLQAAVKTMEQLYVFERNEWKRKNEPRPLTDSHVLSLITSEEHGGPEEDGARGSSVDKTPPAGAASAGTDSLLRREDRLFQTAGSHDERLAAKSVQATSSTGNKNMFSLSSSLKASANAKAPQPNTVTQAPFGTKSFVPKSPKLPTSLKISQTKLSGLEGAESRESERSMQELLSTSADNENYLTIPVKSHASSNKQASSADKTSVYTFTTQTHPTTPSGRLGPGSRGQEDHSQSPKRSSIVMETRSPEMPSATICHSLPLGMSPSQPQVYCFSPAITPAPTLDPFQATQRKMLLDPTTGNYYLVDTPVQPATKRLFDPETGQYVDVPMPQPPMTPVPMPISPLALSPGAYGHTYMIYPGFMPTPSVIPARTLVQSQMSMQSEAESVEKASSQQTEGMYMESPFYMATGKSPQAASGAQQQVITNRPPQGFSGIKQPIISITSQQGPRIIAPPSFDGTTMSFVVEHR